jgi:hypothetical protein
VKTVEFAGCSYLWWSLLAMLAILFVVVARIPRRDTATRPRMRLRAQLPGASSYPHSVAQFEVLSPSPLPDPENDLTSLRAPRQ